MRNGAIFGQFLAQMVLLLQIQPQCRCDYSELPNAVRPGSDCKGYIGIHSDFSKAPRVSGWLNGIIDTLAPRSIATHGNWSWHVRRPGWLYRRLFTTPAANVPCDSFHHPSSRHWEGHWDSGTAQVWGDTWRIKGVRIFLAKSQSGRL
jgi:hypothetical protein